MVLYNSPNIALINLLKGISLKDPILFYEDLGSVKEHKVNLLMQQISYCVIFFIHNVPQFTQKYTLNFFNFS